MRSINEHTAPVCARRSIGHVPLAKNTSAIRRKLAQTVAARPEHRALCTSLGNANPTGVNKANTRIEGNVVRFHSRLPGC